MVEHERADQTDLSQVGLEDVYLIPVFVINDILRKRRCAFAIRLKMSLHVHRGLRPDAAVAVTTVKKVQCTDLGLWRSLDGPNTVQGIAGFHSLLLVHLTGADNPIPSADFKLTVCGEAERECGGGVETRGDREKSWAKEER